MDATTIENPMKACLTAMREQLDQAAGIVKAAETCANSGNVAKGIEIALDAETLLHEVNNLLNAATTINRRDKT